MRNTVDISSLNVTPGQTFPIIVSWTSMGIQATVTKWPNMVLDNALFNPLPPISPERVSSSDNMVSTLTSPTIPGTYKLRVYTADGGLPNTGKETDYKDITVYVAQLADPSINPDSSINLTKTPSATQVPNGTLVTYTYNVTNTGTLNLSTLDNVTITDNVLGFIGGPISLGPGQSQTFTKSQVITSNTTNIATATGILIFQNGEQLSANATATVTVVSATPKPTATPPLPIKGFMTGGGSVFEQGGTRVTHGFTLQCDKTENPNNLEINWNGNKFHLEELTKAICSDDRAIESNLPKAGFNTITGSGFGIYNGIEGVKASWEFTDAGEPGKDDTAKIVIIDGNNTVLTVNGKLDKGNQQAHK